MQRCKGTGYTFPKEELTVHPHCHSCETPGELPACRPVEQRQTLSLGGSDKHAAISYFWVNILSLLDSLLRFLLFVCFCLLLMSFVS